MLFLIGIAAAAVAIILFIIDNRTRYNQSWRVVVGVLAIVLAVVMLVIVCVGTWSRPIGKNGYRNPDTLVGTAPLVALNTDDRNPGGYFFLGTGVVGEEPVYAYIVDSEWGAELTSIPVDKARVREGEDEPRIEYWAACDNAIYVPWPTCSTPLVVFNIPTGSIVRDFQVAP